MASIMSGLRERVYAVRSIEYARVHPGLEVPVESIENERLGNQTYTAVERKRTSQWRSLRSRDFSRSVLQTAIAGRQRLPEEYCFLFASPLRSEEYYDFFCNTLRENLQNRIPNASTVCDGQEEEVESTVS